MIEREQMSDETRASLERGLHESAAGDTVELPEIAEYTGKLADADFRHRRAVAAGKARAERAKTPAAVIDKLYRMHDQLTDYDKVRLARLINGDYNH